MAHHYVNERQVTIRLACQAFRISETCYRYESKWSDENEQIADWLLRLTTTYRRWGFGLCFAYLRNVKGFGWNHKRVYRIYRELELNLRINRVSGSNATSRMPLRCRPRPTRCGR